ncbi:MAG: type II toxin-antitoxin system VapC family toxin [Chloroflexota bacterium]|nr:type II toxin-antitoxin system VapC family toxin [Chloroflexota bacterium]
MTLVVDASVLVAALINSGRTGQWAEATLADGALAGPELALAEACNVLRRHEQAGQLSRFEAAFAYVDLLELDMELFPFAPFAERIWALRENLTSYDAWYVALAEALDCPLATLDLKLCRATGLRCQVLTLPDVS